MKHMCSSLSPSVWGRDRALQGQWTLDAIRVRRQVEGSHDCHILFKDS